MTRIIRLVTLAVGLMVSAPSLATEVAHVDVEAVIRSTSTYAQAKEKVEAYGKTLQKELESEQERMETFYADTLEKVQRGELSPSQQSKAEEQLVAMQEGLQKKAMEADKKLLAKEQELVEPIYAALNKALESVAEEKKLDYIVDVDATLFAGGQDVTEAVRKKLNSP